MESLPPKLDALLAAEPDHVLAGRLRTVAEAAARAVGQLGELDLIQFEEADAQGTADLSMWEEVAPLIGSTIGDVNALCLTIDLSFPEDAVEPDPRAQAMHTLVRYVAQEIRAEVMSFGMRVRDPSVVSDRWNLITELQSFRYRFRDRIGKMVWEAANLFQEGKRREVEPGYEEALSATLVVRAMTSDLRRLMRLRIHKVGDAEPHETLPHALQIEKELNAFGRTAAWRALRAQDKKRILEFRLGLKQLIASGAPTKLELLELLEPFVEFVEGFDAISQRDILLQHDQEVLASVGVVLEKAMTFDDANARLSLFKRALDSAQTLYGRSPSFDAFLRSQRKSLPSVDEVTAALEQFLMQLAGLSGL